MHPVLLSGKRAESMTAQIMAAVKAERWTLQGHEVEGGDFDGEALLVSRYGRTENGGGFSIVLTTYLSTDPRPLAGDEDTLAIVFCFSRNGSVVSTIEFSYGLDSGCWFVVHESAEALGSGMEDPAASLAEELGIELNNEGVDHVHEDHALEQIALAADYAFVHCDDPTETAVA